MKLINTNFRFFLLLNRSFRNLHMICKMKIIKQFLFCVAPLNPLCPHCREVLLSLAPKNLRRNSPWYADHFAAKKKKRKSQFLTPSESSLQLSPFLWVFLGC